MELMRLSRARSAAALLVLVMSAGVASADTNGDGFLTFEDFDVFVVAFEAGC